MCSPRPSRVCKMPIHDYNILPVDQVSLLCLNVPDLHEHLPSSLLNLHSKKERHEFSVIRLFSVNSVVLWYSASNQYKPTLALVCTASVRFLPCAHAKRLTYSVFASAFIEERSGIHLIDIFFSFTS